MSERVIGENRDGLSLYGIADVNTEPQDGSLDRSKRIALMDPSLTAMSSRKIAQLFLEFDWVWSVVTHLSMSMALPLPHTHTQTHTLTGCCM